MALGTVRPAAHRIAAGNVASQRSIPRHERSSSRTARGVSSARCSSRPVPSRYDCRFRAPKPRRSSIWPVVRRQPCNRRTCAMLETGRRRSSASFIGLEVSASLRTRGIAVDVVAREQRPLERVMGAENGTLLSRPGMKRIGDFFILADGHGNRGAIGHVKRAGGGFRRDGGRRAAVAIAERSAWRWIAIANEYWKRADLASTRQATWLDGPITGDRIRRRTLDRGRTPGQNRSAKHAGEARAQSDLDIAS